MVNTEKVMNQILDLKVTSRLLQRQARKCSRSENSEKLKVKKAIEKNNIDVARIYAENSIRKRSEQLNCLRLSARLDAVVSRLQSHAAISSIAESMGSIVKSLESKLSIGDLEKMSETMDRFEKQVVDLEVQAGFVESSMSGSAAISTPEGEVDSLMQQIAEDCGLAISVGLPKSVARVAARQVTEVDDCDLTRRLEELKD